MGFFVSAANMLISKVGIDLRGRDIGVTEKLLDRPQISPAVKHVGGEAVPEGVGRNLDVKIRRLGITL
jgi:hypothetical protein